MKPLIYVSVLAIMIGAIFLAGKPELSSAQKLDGFKLYQFYVFCGNSGLPSAPAFTYEATEGGTVGRPLMGTHTFCVGNCGGSTGPVRLADALAKLPAKVSAALQAQVDKHQETAPAGKRLTCLGDDNKPPEKKCEKPSPKENKAPWVGSNGCESSIGSTHYVEDLPVFAGIALKVDDAGRPLTPGRVRCLVLYRLCDSSIGVEKSMSISVAMWNGPDWEARADAACQPFFETHRKAPALKMCCDRWREGVRDFLNGASSCNPALDGDCDGLPNNQDPFPFHPRPTEYARDAPVTGYPFWKDLENALPQESCQGCRWELADVRYRCQNVEVHNTRGRSNQAKYDYQVKWNCPSTNREIITTRQVTMDGVYCPR